MIDYNIEFAHIYLDEEPSQEQKKSTEIAKQVVKELKEKNHSYSLGMMIDDFSPKKFTLDFESYIENLYATCKFDYVAFESQLAMYTFLFISELPQEFIFTKKVNGIESKTFIKDGIKVGLITQSNKPSCSLLVAIWYLSRLGIYGIPSKTRFLGKNSFYAKNIITILPEKYKNTEQKVLDLLVNTKYQNLLKNIENIYY